MSEMPTQPGRAKSRRPGHAALIAIAVTVTVAGAAGLAYALGWGIADDKQTSAQPSGPPVALQMECLSIKRAFEAWKADPTTINDLPTWKDLDPAVVTKDATEDGDRLYRAVTGYDDPGSKKLALAVAEYNVAVGALHLQATAKGTYSEADYKAAAQTQVAVRDAYNTFWATCALAGVS